MSPSIVIVALTLLAVLLIMLGEAALSAHNERVLRQRGAVEPVGDVYAMMRWAYPACFIVMAIEGAIGGPATADMMTVGLAVFGFAKALKMWAISALGVRWTFRVLVIPDAALITGGPYRFLRHPNYVAVIGEIIGVGLIVRAPMTGLLALAGFGCLLIRRIAVEDRALGRQ